MFSGSLSSAAGQDYALGYIIKMGSFLTTEAVYCQGGQKFRREVVSPDFVSGPPSLLRSNGTVKMAFITRNDLGIRWLINISSNDVVECAPTPSRSLSNIHPDTTKMQKIGEERLLEHDCDIFTNEEGATIWVTRGVALPLRELLLMKTGNSTLNCWPFFQAGATRRRAVRKTGWRAAALFFGSNRSRGYARDNQKIDIRPCN